MFVAMDVDQEREENRQRAADAVKKHRDDMKAEAQDYSCECFVGPLADKGIKKVAHVADITDDLMAELG